MSSNTGDFVHLHVHSEYSMLDGAARLGDVFAEVQRLGMPAVALTDHGNLHGAYDFYNRARAAGVTPILGLEAYVAPGSRFDRRPVTWGTRLQGSDDVSGAGAYTHLTLWARDATGLHNLIRLASRASIEGFFRKPRIDLELLAEHAEGLLATTGCPGGEVSTRLRLGQERAALDAAARLRDILGPDNLYVELMDHGVELERRLRGGLERVGRELGLPFVVTNDAHYTFEREAAAHAALLCVQTASTLGAPTFAFEGSGYYLKSADRMRAIDPSDAWQAGCRSTLEIAERIDPTDMFAVHDLMPRFPVPEGTTEEAYLRDRIEAGMAERFPEGYDERYRGRLAYETDVVTGMGFASYFLVVADVVDWARRNGHSVGPGRGSAAGSLLAYALGITDLDPITHGLIFERFLNPERVSMPDIDIDLDEHGRGEVIRYVTRTYGQDKVAQIATFGTIKSRAAIRDSARVLGLPYTTGDRLAKAMPAPVMGRDPTLAAVFDPGHPRHAETRELRRQYDEDPDARRVLDTARGLEGLIRQTGMHAAGVIMSAEPLVDHIPIAMRSADGTIVTQYDYPTCEALGLLKIDFLGLRTLTILRDAVRLVERLHGVRIDLARLPLDDAPTYARLARGETLGVFQLEGGPMRSLLRSMRPERFEDISAVLALYRPGPMGANAHLDYALRKTGRAPITPIHPELAEVGARVLGETYGLIVYQEQVQRIAQEVAGYSLGQADLLRRAMSKKDKAILDREYEPFAAGMRARGYSDDAVRALWDVLVPFSDYAFNKAHTAGYGLVAYWSAYLEANYPAAYFAALLTSVQGGRGRMALYLEECRRMGIRVLPPDVDESEADFTPVARESGSGDGPRYDIRFGLRAVRNVGDGVVDAIVAARTELGRFTSVHDFLTKVPSYALGKRALESLAKAGAFDSLGHRRRALVAVHEELVEFYARLERQEANGQESLFGFGDTQVGAALPVPALPDLPEWDRRALLAHEREMLGRYVSDHPLYGLEDRLAALTDCTIARLTGTPAELPADSADSADSADPGDPGDPGEPVGPAYGDGSIVRIGGLVAAVTSKLTRQGDPWASITLEDLGGAVEVLVFPSTYRTAAPLLVQDAVLVVTGRVDHRDDGVQLIASELRAPDLTDGADPPSRDADRPRRFAER